MRIDKWSIRAHAYDRYDRNGVYAGKEAPHAYTVTFEALLSPEEYEALRREVLARPEIVAALEGR